MSRKKAEILNNNKNITIRLQQMVKNRKIPTIITEKGSQKHKRIESSFQDEEY